MEVSDLRGKLSTEYKSLQAACGSCDTHDAKLVSQYEDIFPILKYIATERSCDRNADVATLVTSSLTGNADCGCKFLNCFS